MRFDENNLQKDRNNFDLLRVIAATLVLIGHAPLILSGKYYAYDPFNTIVNHGVHSFGLVIFFVISGFLVANSWERQASIVRFFKARVLRLFPGLIVAILLSVLVLGICNTSVDLHTYFTSASTWKYLANMTLFRITYVLPGVFEHNPIGNSINGSLWSLPYEFFCYGLIAMLGLIYTRIKAKALYPLLLLILMMSYIFYEQQINEMTIPLIKIDLKAGMHYFLYLISGSCYYHYRKYLYWHWGLALLVLLMGIILPRLGVSEFVLVLSLPYVVLYLAMGTPKIWQGYHRVGDLSFGVFLYAFPIQQLLVSLFPKLHLLTFIALTIALSCGMAILSWHLIEKRFLAWK